MSFSIVFAIGITKIMPKSKPPTEGIPHNYWVPRPLMPDSVTDIIEDMEEEMELFLERDKEDIDWTGTYQDEDVMWIGGDGDTIWE
jgi:hypothetical protein